MTYTRHYNDFSPATIARDFVNAWCDHEIALDECGLKYLDLLIAELRSERADLSWPEIKHKLHVMVPNLKLGTAGRLLALQYPDAVAQGHLRAA